MAIEYGLPLIAIAFINTIVSNLMQYALLLWLRDSNMEMEINYTNFDGDWNESCAFCGKPNQEHQVNAGAHDGVTYIHYQPCEEQLQQAKQCAVSCSRKLPQLLQRIRARGLSLLH